MKTMTSACCSAAVVALGLAAVLSSSSAVAADVGPACDLAPKVEKTRYQKWPRAAWCEGAKCWLVVWREGDLNEHETDIWCARVAADGKPMDEAGIRVSGAKGIQDRPVVASDGKGFLVAWQDFRNEKDWDVYAARVSADSGQSLKVLDADGFLVSGGEHNQCMPTVAAAGSGYYVAWQSWAGDVIDYDHIGSYDVRGSRISADGKVLDAEGVGLVGMTAVQPSLAADGNGGLALCVIGRTAKGLVSTSGFTNSPAVIRIDPEKGTPQGSASFAGYNKITEDENYVPGVVLMKDGTMLVTAAGWRGGMRLLRFGKDGKQAVDYQKFRAAQNNACIVPMAAISSDGEKTLMTYDFPSEKEELGKLPWRMKVWGWMLSPDGKILDGGQSGFLIAGPGEGVGGALDCMQGVPCAGPKGTFLVVLSEARGMEDTKVVGRIVK